MAESSWSHGPLRLLNMYSVKFLLFTRDNIPNGNENLGEFAFLPSPFYCACAFTVHGYVLHKPAVYHGKPRHTACRNGLDAAQRHSHGVTHERSERSNARAKDIMNEASKASTGRVGRRRHTSKSIEWTEAGRGRVRDVVRHVHAVQSTIQREIGLGCSGEDRICNWEAIQNTPKSMPKGSMCCYCPPYACNYGTK